MHSLSQIFFFLVSSCLSSLKDKNRKQTMNMNFEEKKTRHRKKIMEYTMVKIEFCRKKKFLSETS